jgi:hypothetical protein
MSFDPRAVLSDLVAKVLRETKAAAAVRPSFNQDGYARWDGDIDGKPVFFVFAWGEPAKDIELPARVRDALQSGKFNQWVTPRPQAAQERKVD